MGERKVEEGVGERKLKRCVRRGGAVSKENRIYREELKESLGMNFFSQGV